MLNDDNEESWIEYFIWELNFGNNWKEETIKIEGKDFRLQNPCDLWNLLNL